MTAPMLSDLSPAPSGTMAYTFVDEEELLGFKIWVAELELLVRVGCAGSECPGSERLHARTPACRSALCSTDLRCCS